MKMTKPANFDSYSKETQNTAVLNWIRANDGLIRAKYKDKKAFAYDKCTGELVAEAEIADAKELSISLVGYLGDTMYFIRPEFDIHDNYMEMNEQRIRQVVITGYHAANDTMPCLEGTDERGWTSSAVQYAFFSNLEDAKEACRRGEGGKFKDWDDYVSKISDLIKLKYKLSTEYKHGDRIKTDKYARNGIGTLDMVANRLIAGTNNCVIQTLGNLYSNSTGEFISPLSEVQISIVKDILDKDTIKLSYNNEDICILATSIFAKLKVEQL